MARKTPPRQVSTSVADQIAEELAASALRKRRAGKRPTSQELAALRRLERAKEEARRWAYYESVPKKHYLEMAGDGERPRPAKVILEQADRYKLPLRGKTLNLRHVIRAFHDFLARNKHALAAADADDDALLSAGADSPELERFRAARADLAEMERDERRGKLISADRLREICTEVGATIKSARKRLVKKFGRPAGEILDDAIHNLRDVADRECHADQS